MIKRSRSEFGVAATPHDGSNSSNCTRKRKRQEARYEGSSAVWVPIIEAIPLWKNCRLDFVTKNQSALVSERRHRLISRIELARKCPDEKWQNRVFASTVRLQDLYDHLAFMRWLRSIPLENLFLLARGKKTEYENHKNKPSMDGVEDGNFRQVELECVEGGVKRYFTLGVLYGDATTAYEDDGRIEEIWEAA